MKQVVRECPDLESIAAYLDGRMRDRERAGITEHLASCEDCYAVFAESAKTHEAQQARPAPAINWREWFVGPRLAWASAGATLAIAASVLLLVGPGRMMSSRQPGRELQALVAAVGADRSIEARLAGGFKYGQVRGPVRSGTPSMQTLSPDVRIAVAHIEKALTGIGTPEARHTLGVASLITGDLDRAIPLLEQAVEQTMPDAAMLSDLSAAYLARAERDNRHQDLEKALAVVDRAVKADPALPEALFNRALVLERLSLSDEARAAWEDYLRIDDQSAWANEARTHLSALH
jgi:tetratricopeptide (TPR) repeat protein